jgi:putative transposase
VVTVRGKRHLVRFLVAGGLSQRRACQLVGLGRSTWQYRTRMPQAERDQATAQMLQRLAARHPRYGYRRIWALVRREGQVVNRKRVERLWRTLRLQQPPRPPTRRRARPTPDAARTHATYPGHVWSYDFVQDACMNGTRLRLLPVLDEFTRECLAIHVATSIPAAQVRHVLAGLFASVATGSPACLRSDNGPEFIAEQVRTWLAEQHTTTLYIQPGHPWENGITERFNGTLRDECLNQYAFASLAEARRLVERFRHEYNDVRPHSELGYRTPTQFKREWGQQQANAVPQ